MRINFPLPTTPMIIAYGMISSSKSLSATVEIQTFYTRIKDKQFYYTIRNREFVSQLQKFSLHLLNIYYYRYCNPLTFKLALKY